MPRMRRSAVLLILPLLLSFIPTASDAVRAQEGDGIPLANTGVEVVKDTDLLCAGFISNREITPDFFIIGGEKEGEVNEFTTSNIVYINYGQKHGAAVGESLYVLRQRGEYENPFTGKDVGHYVQELGVLKIIAVQHKVSIARVQFGCDTMRLGDNVRPFDRYVIPPPREFVPLNRFDLPSGKLSGQIILSRYQRDYLAPRDVVYLDIGKRSGVDVGQYYTVYRAPGPHEGLTPEPHLLLRDDDDFEDRADGIGGERYKNGNFSILTGPRKEIDVRKNDRDGLPRKVVGEIFIIRVEDKSATGVITRVTQEVNVGDYVEMQ